jgi:hypothetical protein
MTEKTLEQQILDAPTKEAAREILRKHYAQHKLEQEALLSQIKHQSTAVQ